MTTLITAAKETTSAWEASRVLTNNQLNKIVEQSFKGKQTQIVNPLRKS